ncbi:MAG: hypothetical protein K6E29_07435 [Cyanobacteria bacterium RUI128]|nr:hypothetical protein [Cyanobacteria bacterium RUI128]
MDNICSYKTNSPQFLGRVDSSVYRYVKNMRAEAKKMYVEYYSRPGMRMNPQAAEIVDKRCDSALKLLEQKAELMHKDTVIKVEKNPYKQEPGMYLCAVNKNLTQEWEQKGAVNRISVYNNNLRKINGISNYDGYIACFEDYVNHIKPDKLDHSMVRISIANLWNLSRPKITKGNYAMKRAEATQKMANEIGYQTTFIDSFREHIKDVRAQLNPDAGKNKNLSFWERITSIFYTQN